MPARLERLSPRDLVALKARYAEQVFELDYELGRMFDAMKAAECWDETLIVVTSDHGEELFEHGGFRHGHTLYEELLHVPYIWKLPKSWNRPGGSRIPGLVEIRSLAPTLLAAAGAKVPERISAPSLLPWLLGSESERAPAEIAVAESNGLFSVRDARFKLIVDSTKKTKKLFDLVADPGETNDLASAGPTGTIDPVKGYASDPGECTACMDCLEVCPRKGIAFKPTLAKAAWNHYDPDRRQALFAIGAAETGVALFHNQALAAQTESGDLLPPRLIRPPGALQANADILELSSCIRCAECLRTCPANALQPAVFEAGLAGFGTPVLIPRLGYCDYSCNACGQVCPVGSIPRLSLDEKRQTVIGKAYIDQARCLAWSDHTPCIVCEEMCPLPDKAIWLEEAEVLEVDGRLTIIQLPHVLREDCIGCGICEYKCPVSSEAAIQIYSAPM